MDRFRILRNLPPQPLKWANYPSCVIEDDFTAVIVPAYKASKETADILYSQVPKPYAVFVSNELEPLELIRMAKKTQLESYQMAKQIIHVFEDHRWSSVEMQKLQDLNFNFLREIPRVGFHIWSDNVIGSLWGNPENPVWIHSLSMHRILRFIDRGENLLAKHSRAFYLQNTGLITISGNPLKGFSIWIPYTSRYLIFEKSDSLFLKNR